MHDRTSIEVGHRRAGRWIAAAIVAVAASWGAALWAQDAQWIWSPEHKRGDVPTTSAFFRKTIATRNVESASITIGADDRYELYVNGNHVATNVGWQQLQRHDLTDHFGRGRNTIAIKVTNQRGKTAGVVARVVVKERGGTPTAYATDDSWVTTLSPWPLWTLPSYADNAWEAAQVLGPIGKTFPWIDPSAAPTPATAYNDKPRTLPEARPAAPRPGEANPSGGSSRKPGLARTPNDAGEGRLEPMVTADTTSPAAAAAAPPPAPSAQRFRAPADFEVQQVMSAKESGSFLSMTFNEFGHIVAGKENGPLVLIYDTNRDGIPDKLRTYCDKVKNCQGLLCLNGDVFVVGEGPEGTALYKLSDTNRDATLETVTALVKFKGPLGEHGPHGLTLGPDGMIYIIVGNHVQPDATIAESSPHRNYYEGDLFLPRYEDPGGHAVGIKAPGGTIVRTDTSGSTVEVVCGGIRNAYDLCFNRDGELFTHDSDMEADEGTTWYRPTRLMHLVAGGEYGWRSGWSTWPSYYYDNLPATAETGRGSPTGLVTYDHFAFPVRYHGAIFTCDWAMGRINMVQLAADGATYKGTSTTFIEGEPLNATDIAVGPEGALYFCTGGRDTDGGIYRVVWKGKVPEAVSQLGDGISEAIRMPQPQSAWARQRIATVRQKLGDDWEKLLRGVAISTANPSQYRTRALDLLQWFGPAPGVDLLERMAGEKDAAVRAKAIYLLGLHGGPEQHELLLGALEDEDPLVRRQACESLLRQKVTVEFQKLEPILAATDRFEAWAARRLLERQELDVWETAGIDSEDNRAFLQAALALMVSAPSKERSLKVLAACQKRLEGFLTDADFQDLIRLMQVAVVRGEIKPDDVPELRAALAEEFPAGNHLMNRELARLLIALQVDSIADRYLEYLRSGAPQVETVHLALHLRFLQHEWTPEQKLQLCRFYEDAIGFKGGASYPFYIRHVLRDVSKTFTDADRSAIFAQGETWPNVCLAAIYGLPEKPGEETLAALKRIDTALATTDTESVQQLRMGVIAVLARDGSEASMAYLREIFDQQPERRATVALGLAQQPDGENWKYLVRALALLEGGGAQLVLKKLKEVELAPEEPEYYRQVILCGLRLKDEGAPLAIGLLEFWTGEKQGAENDPWDQKLAAWQSWYHKANPNLPEAKLPTESAEDKWKYADLVSYLTGKNPPVGSVERGRIAYEKALCNRCHKFGDQGESFGPDLTTVSRRFQQREILEAILFPSHVVSDQYAAKTVTTEDGRTLSGLLVPGAGDDKVLIGADGKKTTLPAKQIAEIRPAKKSAMPEGLLNNLTLDEIVDLMTYLRSPPGANVAEKPTPATPRK